MPQNYIEGSEPIPGYHLVSFLGEGGFGKVWKATAPGGAEVALKIIKLGGAQGRKEFRALQRVKRVRHPNLIPVTAFWLKNDDGDILDDALTELESLPTGDTDGAAEPLAATLVVPVPSSVDRPTELIIAMGLGDGSLFARLEECRAQGADGIPVDELLGYMEHSAEGLDFLHRPIHQFDAGKAAIQHCDIKPHNLLIVGGAVQICDFGLARVMGAGQTTTDSASTIAYVAPEFLKDGEPSTATDQYSLAITYFELRTGTLPYSSNTFAGVAKAVMEGTLDLSKLPPAERDVIRKATLSNPKKRHETVADMVRALRGAVDGTPVATSGRSGGRGVGGGTILAAGGIAVLVLAIALLAVRRYAPDRLPRFLARQEVEKVDEPDKDDDIPHNEELHGVDIPVPVDGPEQVEVVPTTPEDDPEQVDVRPPDVVPSTVEETIDTFCSRMALLIDSDRAESYREVIRSVAEAIGRGEQDGRLWRLRGLAHLGLKDPDQAVVDLTEAFGKTADNVDLVHRGEAYYQQDMYDEALLDFNKAIDHFEAKLGSASEDIRQSYAAAYLGRGTIRYMQDDVRAAIEDLETGASHDREDFRFFSRLGSFHLVGETTNDWRLAVGYFDKAITLEASDLDHVNQGRAYVKLNDLESALAAFDAAIRLTPGNADAYYLSGDCYLKQGEKRYDLAIARFTPAINYHDSYEREVGAPLFDLPHAYYYRATCHLAIGKLDEAADDLAWLVDKPGDVPVDQLMENLADAMAEAGRHNEAIRWIKQAIEQSPEANRQQQYRKKLEGYEAGPP